MKQLSLENAWLNWNEVAKISGNKRIIFFGKGEWVEKTLPYLPGNYHYIVDNNPNEQGTEEYGMPVHNPLVLKKEKSDEILIIITTVGFPEVAKQLSGYGFIAGTHFIVSPSLKNYRSIAPINNHDCHILFTCSDQPDEAGTASGGGLYSMTLQNPVPKKILSGNCHGLIKGDDYYYLLDDVMGLRVLDRNIKQVKIVSMPLKSRPHGIAYCKKRQLLFIVFSGTDSIGVFSLKDFKKINEIFISEKYSKTGLPHHHLNDLCIDEDSLFISIVSASGNWKKNVHDGVIVEMDIDRFKILGPVVSNLWYPHTPAIIRGNLCYCDSMRGTVYNTTWKLLTEFNGFVRGISHDGQYFYIGQSSHRYIDRIEGTTNNISLDTGIFLFEESTKITKFFSIPQLIDIKSILAFQVDA